MTRQIELQNASDKQLLTLFDEGRNESSFAELVRRHGPMVRATIRRVSGSKEDTEDAYQSTFFALAKSAKKIQQKAAVAGWLHRAARSCAIDMQRDNIRWVRKSERLSERLKMSETEPNSNVKEDPSTRAIDRELEAILDDELASLPQQFHAAVVLCDLEGLSRTQAAKELEIGRSTLDEHVIKGRRILRERLIRRGVTLPTAGLAAYAATSSDISQSFAATEISTTASKASLFVAGGSAAEIGVSPKVIQVASKVTLAMTKTKLLMVFFVAAAIVAFAGSLPGLVGVQFSVAKAGTLYLDDFGDGNLADGSPVTWSVSPLNPATLDASTGNLLISGHEDGNPQFAGGADALEVSIRNVSARTRIKLTGTGENATVSVRTQNTPEFAGAGYYGGVGYDTFLGGSYAFAGAAGKDGPGLFDGVNGKPASPLNYDVRSEFSDVQIDVFEDQIKVWVWRAGDPMPTEPQFSRTDTTISDAGFIRLSAPSANIGLGNDGSAIFEYVHVADMPIHEFLERGDVDADGTLSVSDIDAISQAHRDGRVDSRFDINMDGEVGLDDLSVWVEDVFDSYFGDANLDGEFNSSDFVTVFQAGKYETDEAAGWQEGDWNGDGQFNSSDFITAFQSGGYEQGPRTAASAVPEPTGLLGLIVALTGVAIYRRR